MTAKMSFGNSLVFTLIVMGCLCVSGCSSTTPKTEPRIVDQLMTRASAGDVDAQYRLGMSYLRGEDGFVDYRASAYWLERAAAAGNRGAAGALGWQYKEGTGVRQDYHRAAELFALGETTGEAACASCLAWLLATCPDPSVRDGARAVRLAQGLVEQDDDWGQWDILAAAYAESGRFDDAIWLQTKLLAELSIQPIDSVSNPVLKDAKKRLDAYRAHHAWRDAGTDTPGYADAAPPGRTQ